MGLIPDGAPDIHWFDRLYGAGYAGGGARDDPRSRRARARNEISVEAHDVLLGNLRAYLGDKAAEQQRTLDDLEDAMRKWRKQVSFTRRASRLKREFRRSGRIETPMVFIDDPEEGLEMYNCGSRS